MNCLLVPYIVQGVAMVARGDAKPDDIDLAMRLGAGYPMGPITLSTMWEMTSTSLSQRVERFPDDPAFQVPEAMELLERWSRTCSGENRRLFQMGGNKRV